MSLDPTLESHIWELFKGRVPASRAKSAFIIFLRYVFSQLTMDEAFRYSVSEPDKGKIRIEDQRHYNDRSVGQFPMVTVGRSSLRSVTNIAGIGSRMDQNTLSFQNEGLRKHTVDSCAVIIRCFSANEDEAEEIAYNCFGAIEGAKETIKSIFNFMALDAIEIGEPIPIQQEGQYIHTMVTVSLVVQMPKEYGQRRLDEVALQHVAVDFLANFVQPDPDDDGNIEMTLEAGE